MCSCLVHIAGSCFCILNSFSNIHLSIGIFNPFTFTVTTLRFTSVLLLYTIFLVYYFNFLVSFIDFHIFIDISLKFTINILKHSCPNLLQHGFIFLSLLCTVIAVYIASLYTISPSVTSLSLFTFMHWRRQWQPTPVFLPGESQGWGSLVGCYLWGRTESDTTEVT